MKDTSSDSGDHLYVFLLPKNHEEVVPRVSMCQLKGMITYTWFTALPCRIY